MHTDLTPLITGGLIFADGLISPKIALCEANFRSPASRS
jgi:hypothetical protein